MNKLMLLIKQPWAISLFGILALAALIWFATPYIAIAGREPFDSPIVRILIILLLFVLWGFVYLYKQLKAARAGEQMIDDLASSAAETPADAPRSDESAEEVALLKRNFDEAMDVLKKERKKGGAGNLYSMPWYVIIGPPAAGKTTALLNSGLKFPLQERFGRGELRGVGGTRNCDWLFTDQAVLLDTAGRYVTQDSHAAVDSAAWEGFLNLLKKRRRRRPVNGVLVAISLVDMMQQNAAARDMHVRAIKQRVQELYQHFGMRLPVYVLFTKCDLVAGFTEFFDDLGREERAQVWGFTLPLVSDEEEIDVDIAGRVNAEFDQLLARLNARLLTRLSQEGDFKRRDLIYGFPRQLASLQPTLAGFLADVFQSSRYEEPILLRGVYLTSGTQEGTPIDRLMGAIARTFGLQQQVLPAFNSAGRSYFINRLLNEVVFRETGLAGSDPRVEARRAWLQRGSYAAVLVVTGLAALLWLISYSANTAHVGKVADSLTKYEEIALAGNCEDSSEIGVLTRLEALRASIASAKYEDGVPLRMRFGLYQGAALADAANDAYVRELNVCFLPFVVRKLEAQLRSAYRDPTSQYEALKTYLMLGNSERMEAQQVSQWMKRSWQDAYQGNPVMQQKLQQHLDALLQGGIIPAVLDERLVSVVRKNLERLSLAHLVYARLKHDVSSDRPTDFRVTDAVGDAAEEVFLRAGLEQGIPALYTYEGFHRFYLANKQGLTEQVRADDWVLAGRRNPLDSRTLERLDEDVHRLYLDDYIASWEQYLANLKIKPFRDVRHATEVLEVLSGPSSPIISLLEVVAQNTTLSRLPAGVADQVTQAAGMSPVGLAETKVDRYFQPLNRLVTATDNRPPPIQRLIDLFSELYDQLMAIESGYDSGPVLDRTASTGLLNTLQQLQIEGARQPEPVKSWLQQVANHSQLASMGSARERLNVVWASNLRLECEKALSRRYPLDRDGRLDVSIDDFARFFGPSGELDQFFEEHLKPLVDTSGRNWQWLSLRDGTTDFSSEALRQMQRAAAIREAFFMDGGQIPNIRFELKPVYLDNRVKRVSIDLEGQGFEYYHGPQRFEDAQWPGPRGSSEVRIVFRLADRTKSTISEEGPWAWFRILDRVQKKIKSPDRFVVSFEADGYRADYEIQASSVINPFIMRDLYSFRCPMEF